MCLLGKNCHVTAKQVLADVRDLIGAEVSKATVYNTLGWFAREGLWREVVIDAARLIDDTNTREHHHLVQYRKR